MAGFDLNAPFNGNAQSQERADAYGLADDEAATGGVTTAPFTGVTGPGGQASKHPGQIK